jgi:hypothetical protein
MRTMKTISGSYDVTVSNSALSLRSAAFDFDNDDLKRANAATISITNGEDIMYRTDGGIATATDGVLFPAANQPLYLGSRDLIRLFSLIRAGSTDVKVSVELHLREPDVYNPRA